MRVKDSSARHKDAILPVKEGWYWFKGIVKDKFIITRPQIVLVVENIDEEGYITLEVYLSRDPHAYNISEFVGVWTGPFWEPNMG